MRSPKNELICVTCQVNDSAKKAEISDMRMVEVEEETAANSGSSTKPGGQIGHSTCNFQIFVDTKKEKDEAKPVKIFMPGYAISNINENLVVSQERLSSSLRNATSEQHRIINLSPTDKTLNNLEKINQTINTILDSMLKVNVLLEKYQNNT